MSHIPPVTGMRLPGQLDTFFTRSMTVALAAVGASAGLEPLEWRARTLQGEVVVHGSPPRDTELRDTELRDAEPPADLCERWASALGLDEYSYDALDGVTTWSRYESPWLIEVSSAPL